MKRDELLYGGAIVLFGGVVLWATDAPWEATAIAAVTAGLLLFAAAVLVRPAPDVLLVGEGAASLEVLDRALRRDGFEVQMCPGPGNSACPVLAGRPCPAHGDPVAAVVIRRLDDTSGLAPCGAAFHIPELAVEEASNRAPELVGRYGRVGIERGADAVTEALDRLLAGATAAAS